MKDIGSYRHSCEKSATKKLNRKRKHIDEQGEPSKTIKTAISAIDRNQAVDTTTEHQLNKKEYSARMNRNLAELKDALRGTPYELKLAFVVSLANAKKTLDPRNKLSIKVSAENPELGNFKNIIYEFNDEGKTGTLKIQIKHELRSPLPRITLDDVTTTEDLKNPFAILKHFTSFYDQPPQSAGTEGIIICTNTDIDGNARKLWKPVDPDSMDDSTTSLDSCVSSLFNKVGGKCYRLDFDTLTDGSFNELYQRCREYSKCTRLAKLLVMAIKSKSHRLTKQNPLVGEYHGAILSIIDTNDSSNSGSYKFTEKFLNSSLTNIAQGYDDFRLEFEEEYSEVENVWKVLKDKRIHVAEDFQSKPEQSEENELALIFPGDDVDERLMEFCQKVRLVCYNNNEHELYATIGEFWKDMHLVEESSVNQLKRNSEESIISAKVNTNFNWLMDIFFKPVNSANIEQEFRNIKSGLAVAKLRGAFDQLYSEITRTPFRISPDALKASDLYDQIFKENYLQLDAYDIYFGAAVLSDIISLQEKEPYDIFFMKISNLITDSKNLKYLFRSTKHRMCFIIICNELSTAIQRIVQEWQTYVLRNSSKQVFIISKSNNTRTDFSYFRIRDVTEESREQFKNKNISLCSTTISPVKVFNFKELSIEEVIRLLDGRDEMEEKNEISKKYHEMESTYVHRPWIDSESNFKAGNIWWNKDSPILKCIKEPQQEEMSIKEITKILKKEPKFIEMFEKPNNPEVEHEPIIGSGVKKVLILLGEAGLGKSSNLTWMAWYLRKQNPSCWVVLCNLADNFSSFKPFIQHQNNRAGEVIDETDALRMLYKLVCSSLQLQHQVAEKCSKFLVLSDGEAILNENQMDDLSLNNLIQLLVFKEKFNAGKLVLLLDGFDEIAPLYKEVVFNLLSFFELFKGVETLFLTSRPYGFKEQLQIVFKDPSFFQFKPLSLKDKGSILYKLMKEKWHYGNIDDEKPLNDFYKSLCFMLLCSLGDMSDVPLNLMMAVDILGERVYQNGNININLSSKTFSRKLLELIVDFSKASFIVEEFVKVKIRHLLYDKIGADKNVAVRPKEMERFEKAMDEAKLLHGLVALWVLFNYKERHIILSANEIQAGEDYMKKIYEGSEKTEIIHASTNGGIRFIHQKFAEYLAAWWFVKRRIEGNKQGAVKLFSFQPFWDEERKELRKNVDSILAKRFPLHVAIIEKEWEIVKSLLSENLKSFYKRDDGNRTPFFLIALYYDFEEGWPPFLPDSIGSNIINKRDQLFSWTAMDYAFYRDKPQLICYLLHHGASINVNLLFEQIVSSKKNIVRNAAKYARYVTGYLSSEPIEYESHDACKKMKQFCDKVVANLDIESSANSEPMPDHNNRLGKDYKGWEKQILVEIIEEDSVWMLESIIHRWTGRKHFVRMIMNSFFNLKSETESMFVLKYFMTKYPSILCNDNLWDCIILSVTQNYKDEFKYFFDLYCYRFQIKDFQPCLIQNDSIDCSIPNDVVSYLIDYVENNVGKLVCVFRNSICWAKMGIPAEIMNDKNIFSLLIICVTLRPSMLRYLIESCKLNLCPAMVYSLAMIADNLFSKLHRGAAIKPNNSYECLLDLASYISDVEANKMLRLAITSQLFEFSKCLIERFKIDFQAVDDIIGSNVFHLCASNQRSFWVDEIPADDTRTHHVARNKTELFRYMLAKETDMDCFEIIDKKGKSILHLAMENGPRGIAEHILVRTLELNNLDEIKNIKSVDAIPNITFCYRTIRKISKCVGEQWWHYKLICILAKQVAKISLTNREELLEPNSGHLLNHEDATELYQMAMKSRSLFLMYYLHREFPNAIPTLIHNADWLACTARSLMSQNFLNVTKWLLNPTEVDKHVNLYKVVEECDDEGYDLSSVDLEELIKQTEAILSADRSVEELCKLKLLAVAVCLNRESMISQLSESFILNIDWKVLIDIMEIAHCSRIDEPGTKDTDGCAFEKPDFIPIYKYLFERTSNFGETDAEGRNVLHLAAQSGLGCLVKFLIKHNKDIVKTTSEQNGWNIFHYYASRKGSWSCSDTDNNDLLTCITERVLEVTSDDIPPSFMTESRKNKLKDLCFNSDDGRKSVIHVAVEADNISTAEFIIECCLETYRIGEHEIRNSDECSRFRECYDELSQIAAQLPFNAWYDYLLHKLAKPIHRFSPENIAHITGQHDADDHIVEDACRSAIRYRSLITLEHLIIACENQMDQSLARSTSHELVSSMMECIRRNRTSLFKVFVGHYRTLQGILPRVEVEFGVEDNDNIDEDTINEYEIKWHIIDQFTEDVAMNRDYLPLFILSVAYGRLSMTRYLVEMLQLEVNKSLIVLIMKVLEGLWDHNCDAVTPVYEYLANRSEGKPNLLRLCIQAGCTTMFKYLIKERKLDPNEVDSENGCNVGHYCVSDPNVKSGYEEFTWLVDKCNMDCFGVYDRKGRNILHLALENGYDRAVKHIIIHRLGLIGDKQPLYEWESEKIEILINELQQIVQSLPDNIPKQNQQIIHYVLGTVDFYLVNRTSANTRQIEYRLNDNERNKKNTEDTIEEDSARMLESGTQKVVNKKLFFELFLISSYFDLALKSKSVFVLAYVGASDPSLLRDEYLWKCAVYALLKNYNIELKYFVDLYCSRFKFKDFQPCSIQSDKAYYRIDYSKSDEIDEVCDVINKIYWSKLGIPDGSMINEKLLSLLVICVATVRPSMLRYLIESCKLNLCAGIVYSLVMISYESFSKTHRKRGIKLNQSYKCVLDLASNITDFEANKMLRLAITSHLFEFSEYLIERFQIDFQAVDEINYWNVFHLCASNQRSFWVDEIPADDTRTHHVDRNKTKLFCYMMAKESNIDCFGIIDKRGRSILHLAMENGQRGIVEHILARKWGINNLDEIKNIKSVDAIPNITFCYRAVREISKSVGEQWWHYKLICTLAKQIVKIPLTNREESQESNSVRLLLHEDAKDLYQIAMKCRSLFLMYYLHREFPNAIPPLIYDADWLACTVDSLRSPDFLDVTKWLLNPNEVDKHDFLYEVVEECDDEGYDFSSVDLEELNKQAEAILSANRSLEELCKLKLLAIAVCLNRESMIRHLCETFNDNIDWKVLIDIMEIAHCSRIDEPETKDTDGCAFEKPDFIPIYRYLFERTSNLGEIDAEGRYVLHLAAQSGLGCLVKFLIKHNMVDATITNVQNGWNPFHYYASRKGIWKCGITENDNLLELITKRVLWITSDGFPLSSLTEIHKNKLKVLCFNEGRENVIHVAVEAGNIDTAKYIIECRLGINRIDKHEIRNSDECSRFRECYDELSQIAAQLPFNGRCDYLLHRLAKSIHGFSPENIAHITGQHDADDHIVEDACRSAIRYRSLITLEHLIIACENQMDQSLARSTSHELVSSMMECIRQNRSDLFKVLVGHYRTLQGILPRVEVEFGVEDNDNIDEDTINEYEIKWQIINEFTENLAMNRDYLPLFILSVAYGRLSMTRYLVEMLQLEVNKSLIVLIMKVLEGLWDHNCDVVTPVYEYLVNRCEGKPNLLRLCTQARCTTILKYLIEERKLDPNEIDSESGWNAGHYCVSGLSSSGYNEFTWLVDQYNMDCFGVYDRKGRNILHLALENGYDRAVKHIINHRLGLIGDKQPWYELDLVKIENLINELQLTLELLPENIPQQKQQVIQNILEKVRFQKDSLTTYQQLFTNQT